MTPALIAKPIFAHIQILRAIAVVLVVGFHMGWPGFSFGYLGVDIFFVISGFLMFQIYSELESNKIRSFYFRRLKRLLPAYLFVSLATTFIFFLVTLPFERVSLVTQNLYANLLISNFYYWTENQYFVSGGLRPLLTFWSLALELQFYLIFPIVFIMVKKYNKLFFLMILFSGLIHILLNMISPETAFFLLPARLWEFLIGTAVAVKMNSQLANTYFRPRIFHLVTYLMILLVVLFPFAKDMQDFYSNFIVVVITSFLLKIGFALGENQGFIRRILLILGKYSYSIYLVHLPIICLICYQPFSGNLKPGANLKLNLFCILLIIIFAYLVFYLIENPFRQIKNFQRLLSLYLTFFMIAVLSFALVPTYKNINTSLELQKISFSQENRTTFRCGTISRIEILHKITSGPESCLLSSQLQGKKHLLIGNSYADSIKSALNNKLEESGNSLYILRDNLWLSSINLTIAKNEIINRSIDVVILHQRGGVQDKQAFNEMVKFVKKQNKKLMIIGPTPDYQYSIPLKVYENFKFNEKLDVKNINYFEKVFQDEIRFFKSIADGDSVIYLDALKAFCLPACQIRDQTNGNLFYFDEGHLTVSGASFLVSRLGASF
jgi:peptidoglycan/LPS O-acetylase OafA/YrhL